MIAGLDLGPDGPGREMLRLEVLPVNPLLLQAPAHPLHHPMLLRGARCGERLLEAESLRQPREWRIANARPFCDRRRKGVGARPSEPHRAINA